MFSRIVRPKGSLSSFRPRVQVQPGIRRRFLANVANIEDIPSVSGYIRSTQENQMSDSRDRRTTERLVFRFQKTVMKPITSIRRRIL